MERSRRGLRLRESNYGLLSFTKHALVMKIDFHIEIKANTVAKFSDNQRLIA